jgi:hypothetical protein
MTGSAQLFAKSGRTSSQKLTCFLWSHSSARPDSVAPLAIFELKRSFTFDLVAQAFDRKRYAHHVYVAVPWTKASDGRRTIGAENEGNNACIVILCIERSCIWIDCVVGCVLGPH